jgi:hypothetical protein
MADWEEIGHRLYEQWAASAAHCDKAFIERMAKPLGPEFDFVRALIQHARGNSSYLNNYLRSDRVLSPLDRELLAQVNEGVLDRKPERHRPKNKRAHQVALCARAFYRAWQEACKNAGISTWGLANPMKDEACNYALLLETDDEQPKFDSVRELIG